MPSERPDGQWPVMLINRDHDNDRVVRVSFADSKTKRARHFAASVDRITFGPNECQWHDEEGGRGHADPDGPASKSTVQGGADVRYSLPKASVVVLHGHIGKNGLGFTPRQGKLYEKRYSTHFLWQNGSAGRFLKRGA